MTISVDCRRRFAAFLMELAEGHRDAQKWHVLIVEHYHDKRLEAIRVEVVRQSIAGAFDPAQLREWATELQGSILPNS